MLLSLATCCLKEVTRVAKWLKSIRVAVFYDFMIQKHFVEKLVVTVTIP